MLAGPTPHPQELRDPVISATLSVYTKVASQLLPTPTRSHYTFNLRDISRVMQVRRRWYFGVLCVIPGGEPLRISDTGCSTVTLSVCGCQAKPNSGSGSLPTPCVCPL